MHHKLLAVRRNRALSTIIGIWLVSALGFTGVGWAATTSTLTAFPTTSTTSGSLSFSITPPKNTFNILMNYELGMHCTGFEFSYCCVLPPYNSILAQVVKTQQNLLNGTAFPRLLEADPNVGLDFLLQRPTVLRDTELDASGNFKKYVLRYWHDAQPRNDGRGAPQTSTLISQVEGNSLLMWNTVLQAALVDTGNRIQYGTYDGQNNVVLGDGGGHDQDNYANAWLNHLYIYSDLSGGNPANTSLEVNKIRLGLPNTYASTPLATILPQNSGPAFHPMGPGANTAPWKNVLTFSGDSGTVVYTQMKVLENLPVMLTSPRIWEALGLPLTPFEDTINFFGAPGKASESTVRPYVKMQAQLHNFDSSQPGGIGTAVLQNGNPIIGFGTAPIDIPNCERCHALGDGASVNSPQNGRPAIAARVQGEINFWNTYYNINVAAGDSDWYSRLKGAAISILSIHDLKHGTSFTANYPVTGGSGIPQETRLGHDSVMCQKCHADNVIAKVKSANVGTATADNDPVGTLIPPLTEAIHNNHSMRPFNDSLGRNGSCQGCHPAHRSDGIVDNSYPITKLGLNAFASGDNRDAAGGCYVGRDVHSNRNRAADLAGGSHLNAVGSWLVSNVAMDTGTDKGIWCTNCHSQFSQELWRAENVKDLVHSKPGDPGNVREPKANAKLADVAKAAGVSLSQAIAWLDPKTVGSYDGTADTFAIWNDPGFKNYPDANVATIEVSTSASGCGSRTPVFNSRFGVYVCVTLDGDVPHDPSVRILDFCTTSDCVAAAQITLNGEGNSSIAAPVPFDAATDGRDHWLSPGEPHCADCHKAPYVEQSGNVNFFPPFNYPRKASLFRYSRGHRDITCQGCHESIHGLYPVTSNIDTTTYAQAASMNTDGKHGPLKCGACHVTNSSGVAINAIGITYNGVSIANNFDAAVGWAHTFTNEADPKKDVCVSCHTDLSAKVSATDAGWLLHTTLALVSRKVMDEVETEQLGHVSGDPAAQNPLTTVCTACHTDLSAKVSCSDTIWKQHVPFGAVAQSVWLYVTNQKLGSPPKIETCGF